MHGSTRERTGMTDCGERPGAGRQVGPHVPQQADLEPRKPSPCG